MDAIRIYINNLFESLAKTPESERLRLNMLRDSEERYDELRVAGHSEAEALGIVIQQFGNFEDIRAQFGGARTETTLEDEETKRLKHQMREDYRRFQPRFALAIGIGVFFCIIGIIAAAFTNQAEAPVGWITLAFFLPVAIGVIIFIYFSMQMERFKSFFRAQRMYEHLDEESYETMRRLDMDESTAAGGERRSNRKIEALSSSLWLLATVAYLLMGFLGNLWHPGWVVFLVAALLQPIISVFAR